MSFQPMRRALVPGLVLALLLLTSGAPALAGDLRGRVTDVDGSTPRAGVVVTLYDQKAEATFSSEPTDAKGVFHIGAAPAGEYRVLVETEDGAYLADDSLALEDGSNRPLALNLQAAPAVGEEAPGTPGSTLRPWAKWVIVGGIALGAIVVVDAVTSEDEASGF